MARTPSAPPEDFVEFVERRDAGLRLAAHALTGNDRLAESLVQDLLAATAARWRRLTRSEDSTGRASGADGYLDRIFLREAASWRRDQPDPRAARADLRLLRQGPDSAAAARLPGRPAIDAARLAWARAERGRRRWGYVAAGLAAVILVAVFAPRGVPEQRVEAEPPPPAAPDQLPEWIDVLPTTQAQGELPWLATSLPQQISLANARPLSQHRIDRAMMLLLPQTGAPLVLGPDGGLRVVDIDGLTDARQPGRLGSTPITAASLSRDGTRAAFLNNTGVAVVDLVAARSRQFSVDGRLTDVAWLAPGTLLVAGPRTTRVLDLASGEASSTTVDARHMLTRQAVARATAEPSPVTPTGAPLPDITTMTGLVASQAAKVVELLPIGEPATAPARVRRYVTAGASVSPVVTPISGDRTGWVGRWIGPGFMAGDLVARDCDARELTGPLPSGRPAAFNATVVVDARSGLVKRALVASRDATTLPDAKLLGFTNRDGVLIVTGTGTTARILLWDTTNGLFARVAEIADQVLVSVADVTLAA